MRPSENLTGFAKGERDSHRKLHISNCFGLLYTWLDALVFLVWLKCRQASGRLAVIGISKDKNLDIWLYFPDEFMISTHSRRHVIITVYMKALISNCLCIPWENPCKCFDYIDVLGIYLETKASTICIKKSRVTAVSQVLINIFETNVTRDKIVKTNMDVARLTKRWSISPPELNNKF